MRYNTKYALRFKHNNARCVRKFLFLPKSFDENEQGRWLEYADIIERVVKVDIRTDDNYDHLFKWKEIGFADEVAKSKKVCLNNLYLFGPYDEAFYKKRAKDVCEKKNGSILRETCKISKELIENLCLA